MLWLLPLVWVAGATVGLLYSHQQGIPMAVAGAALPAFLLEVTFYCFLGIEKLRARIEKLPPSAIAALLTIAGVLPYCAAALTFGSFEWRALCWIGGLSAIASFWHVALKPRAATDLLFLAFMLVVILTNVLRHQYVNPHPKLRLDELGHLMWFRTGIFAMLSVRKVKGVGFGFWPGIREWGIGVAYFAMFVPLAAVLAWAIGFAHPHFPTSSWDKTTVKLIGTFFGILWVVALAEEFFFRGLLQQWLGKWLKNEGAGLAAAAILFGSVHLWYRPFPNWKFAVLASLAGIFYGLAFRRARSIRASMVTHALTVTAWRVFFSN